MVGAAADEASLIENRSLAGGSGLKRSGLERSGLERSGLERSGLERSGLGRSELERRSLKPSWSYKGISLKAHRTEKRVQ